MDKATSVKVGLAPPPVAKQDDPAMNKLCIPCTLQSAFTTPFLGSSLILVVPIWCQPPLVVEGTFSSFSSHNSSRSFKRPKLVAPACCPIISYIFRILLFSRDVKTQFNEARG